MEPGAALEVVEEEQIERRRNCRRSNRRPCRSSHPRPHSPLLQTPPTPAQATKGTPVDLLNADEDGDESHSTGPLSGRNDLPQYYEPEPFLVPDPTSNDGHTMFSERPLSGSSITGSRSATPDLLGYAASAARPRPRRGREAHQDTDGDAETIELPPAYTNIKKMAVPSDGERTEVLLLR
ncbi:hypothetical protein BDQ17DRAFT_1421241 [Cyathus striatus]|nr:hypothetical protein BDQ17DRAFT_1421241 [Cyathus striatus]